MINSSILFCAEFALMKELVNKGLVSKEEIIKNYKEIRIIVPNFSEIELAEKLFLDYLEIE